MEITNKTSFTSAMNPFMKMVRKYYDFSRKKKFAGKDLEYTGYPINIVGCLPIEDRFKHENIEYDKEEGKGELEIVLLVAYQLGYSMATVHEKDEELADIMRGMKEYLIKEGEWG